MRRDGRAGSLLPQSHCDVTVVVDTGCGVLVCRGDRPASHGCGSETPGVNVCACACFGMQLVQTAKSYMWFVGSAIIVVAVPVLIEVRASCLTAALV